MEQQTLQPKKSEQPIKLSTHLLNVLNATIPGFIIDSDNRKELDLIGKYIDREQTEGIDINKGLMILGNPGSGKTELMLAMQTVYRVTKHPLAFKFKPVWKVATDFGKDGFDAIDSYQTGHWFFDELGLVERETVSHFGNKVNVAESIIHARYNSFKRGFVTHLTSNLNEEQITLLYDERISSRLHEMCNVIFIAGADRRLNATGKQLITESQAAEIDEKEKQRIMIEGAVRKFNDFKSKGYCEDFGNSTYNFLANTGVINFTESERESFKREARKKLAEEARKETLLAKMQFKTAEARKLNDLVSVFENIRDNSEDQKIIREAKKLALNEYFARLVKEGKELEII